VEEVSDLCVVTKMMNACAAVKEWIHAEGNTVRYVEEGRKNN